MKILVVDDDPEQRGHLRQALSLDEHVIEEASDGRAAWELFAADPGGFDMVLTDIRMPEMNGLELLRQIRDEGHCTPVTILSGQGELDDAVAALRMGAFDFIIKPAGMGDLRATIERLESVQLPRRERQVPVFQRVQILR